MTAHKQTSFRAPDKLARAFKKEKVDCALWRAEIKSEIVDAVRRNTNVLPNTKCHLHIVSSIPMAKIMKAEKFSNNIRP